MLQRSREFSPIDRLSIVYGLATQHGLFLIPTASTDDTVVKFAAYSALGLPAGNYTENQIRNMQQIGTFALSESDHNNPWKSFKRFAKELGIQNVTAEHEPNCIPMSDLYVEGWWVGLAMEPEHGVTYHLTDLISATEMTKTN